MKKQIWLLIMLVILALTGCQNGEKKDPSTETEPIETETESIEIEGEVVKEKVVVKVEDGQVWLKLIPENWPQLAGQDGWDQDMDFTLVDINDRVKAVCAGEIWGPHEALGQDGAVEYPVLVFLMEDGSLEWTVVDPAWYKYMVEEGGNSFVSSYGKVLWLDDIVSLSYESTKEGTGRDMTILAVDQDGVAYDLRHALNLQALGLEAWPIMLDLNQGISAYLIFARDGTLYLDKADRGEVIAPYQGTYQVYLATDGQGGLRPGSIRMDLALAEGQWAYEGAPETIRGDYYAEIVGGEHLVLQLHLADGDPLHSLDGEAIEDYAFHMPIYYTSEFVLEEATDEDLVIQLLAAAPEANHLVEVLGMEVLVTGETTHFGDGYVCRNIWLGTNDDDAFVKEILYTIGPDGMVYKYDPLGDAWDIASFLGN